MARVRCWLAICRSNDFAKKSRSKSRNDFCVRGKKISHISPFEKYSLFRFFFLVRCENTCLRKLIKISNECYCYYLEKEEKERDDQSLSKWIWILIDRVYINRSYYLVKQLNKKFPSNLPKKYISPSLRQFFHTC